MISRRRFLGMAALAGAAASLAPSIGIRWRQKPIGPRCQEEWEQHYIRRGWIVHTKDGWSPRPPVDGDSVVIYGGRASSSCSLKEIHIRGGTFVDGGSGTIERIVIGSDYTGNIGRSATAIIA